MQANSDIHNNNNNNNNNNNKNKIIINVKQRWFNKPTHDPAV